MKRERERARGREGEISLSVRFVDSSPIELEGITLTVKSQAE